MKTLSQLISENIDNPNIPIVSQYISPELEFREIHGQSFNSFITSDMEGLPLAIYRVLLYGKIPPTIEHVKRAILSGQITPEGRKCRNYGRKHDATLRSVVGLPKRSKYGLNDKKKAERIKFLKQKIKSYRAELKELNQ